MRLVFEPKSSIYSGTFAVFRRFGIFSLQFFFCEKRAMTAFYFITAPYVCNTHWNAICDLVLIEQLKLYWKFNETAHSLGHMRMLIDIESNLTITKITTCIDAFFLFFHSVFLSSVFILLRSKNESTEKSNFKQQQQQQIVVSSKVEVIRNSMICKCTHVNELKISKFAIQKNTHIRIYSHFFFDLPSFAGALFKLLLLSSFALEQEKNLSKSTGNYYTIVE